MNIKLTLSGGGRANLPELREIQLFALKKGFQKTRFLHFFIFIYFAHFLKILAPLDPSIEKHGRAKHFIFAHSQDINKMNIF